MLLLFVKPQLVDSAALQTTISTNILPFVKGTNIIKKGYYNYVLGLNYNFKILCFYIAHRRRDFVVVDVTILINNILYRVSQGFPPNTGSYVSFLIKMI